MKALLALAALLWVLAGCGIAQSHSSAHAQAKKGKSGKGHRKPTAGGEQAANKQKENAVGNKAIKTTAKGEISSDEKEITLKPEYKLGKNQYIKPIGDANPKVVLLTIDDAPAEHAVEMAKTLKKLHAKAIFFIIGNLIDSKDGKEKLKKITQMGFPVGDHTQTHPNLPDIPAAKQKTEIMSVYNKINHILGRPPKFFRAPYGQTTNLSDELSNQHRMLEMNWSYGYDWDKQYENSQSLTKIMVNSPYLANGAILLMHDRNWTVKALPKIVKGLRAKGYQILNPSLLKTP